MIRESNISELAVRPRPEDSEHRWKDSSVNALPRFQNAAAAPADLSRQMIETGAMAALSEFADKEAMLELISKTLLETVEEIEGKECRRLVERDGMDRLHAHFPVDKVKSLRLSLERKIGHELYRWAGKVGEQDLKLGEDFYIDHLIMLRIHYPYRIGLKARAGSGPSRPRRGASGVVRAIGAKMSTAWFTARSQSRTVSAVRRKFRLMVIKWSKLEHQTVSYNLKKYFRNQPEETWVHGPHIDTWYGHSYDGLNLWWAITGVTEETGMNLYPSLFGEELKFSPVSMYLAAGQPLPRPTKTPMQDGELLVFNPEILHSTQLNISDKTRFVITLRLNPQEPKFDTSAVWNFTDWYRWRDVKAGRFRLLFFPAHKYPGQPRRLGTALGVVQKSTRIRVRAAFRGAEEHRICEVGAMPVGEKALVAFDDASLIVIRGQDGVHAVSSSCPHVGIGLQDGYHDGVHLYCPGHGLKFDYRTGESDCSFLRIRKFAAEVRHGAIYVGATGSSPPAPSA